MNLLEFKMIIMVAGLRIVREKEGSSSTTICEATAIMYIRGNAILDQSTKWPM
jgi:hypothetical protein